MASDNDHVDPQLKATCPICRSTDLTITTVSDDFRCIYVRCAACGERSVLAYPLIKK